MPSLDSVNRSYDCPELKTFGHNCPPVLFRKLFVALAQICETICMWPSIGHFQVAVDLIMKARLSAKAFHVKISFVCI